ncbi:MAG: hypothetical protein RLZZ528_1304 [Pseudomonadota bacterium]|jgi:hypothetical protein
MRALRSAYEAYRWRWKRRALIWRAVRARHQLQPLAVRTGQIGADAILCLACVRDEADRLPRFLDHHRALGVGHFLIVDNASSDDTPGLLRAQGDVSLWVTSANYRAARFGMDWIDWLLFRYGHGHWCLTVDADERLVFADPQGSGLRGLTRRLDDSGRPAFPALLLDLYPGPDGEGEWFDPGPYGQRWQPASRSVWIQGGPRARALFPGADRRAPTLNKIPLVRWNRRFAHLNAVHTLLPRRLNAVWETAPSGVLLHDKLLGDVPARAVAERRRGQHFGRPGDFTDYYDALAAGVEFHHDGSLRYSDWRQLADLGLLSTG